MLGSSTNDIALTYLEEIGGNVTTLTKSWYLAMTEETTCLNARMITTMGYIVIHQKTSSLTLFGQVDTTGSATSITFTQTSFSSASNSQSAYSAWIDASTGSFFYHVGYLTQINTQTFSKNIGFVMKFPQTSCITSTPTTVSQTATYQSAFVVGTINTPLSVNLLASDDDVAFQYKPQNTLTDLVDPNVVQLPSTCLGYQNIGSITPTVIANQIYTIDDPQIDYTMADFSYNNGTGLPGYIQFTQLGLGLGAQFTIVNSDNNTRALFQFDFFYCNNKQFTSYNHYNNDNYHLNHYHNNDHYHNNYHNYYNDYYYSSSYNYISTNYYRGSYDNSISNYYNDLINYYFSCRDINSCTDYNNFSNFNTCHHNNASHIRSYTLLLGGSTRLDCYNSTSLPSFITVTQKYILMEPAPKDVGNYSLTICLSHINELDQSKSSIYFLGVEVLKTQQLRDYNKPVITTQPKNNTQVNQSVLSNITEEDMKFEFVNIHGEVKISFSQKLQALLALNMINLVDLKFILQQGSSESEISSWRILENGLSSVVIKLAFDSPGDISLSQIQDQLKVSFQNKLQQQSVAISVDLPPQLDDEDIMDQTSQVTAVVLESVLYGSAGLSVLFGTSIQMVWGLVNTLQLITHTPLFNIPYTSEIMILFKAVITVTTFDPFNSSDYLKIIFNLQDVDSYEPYNYRFEFLEYSSSNFVYLIGPPFFFLLTYFAMMIFHFLLKQFSYFRKKQFVKKLSSFLYYNYFLRFFIELALEAGLSIIINFDMIRIDIFGEVVSLMFSIFFMIILLLLAFGLPFYLNNNYQDLEATQFVEKYEDIVCVLNIQRKSCILYHSIFIIRRILYILIVFGLQEYLTLQIFGFIYCNLFYLIYLIYFNPTIQNRYLEIYNEVVTIILSHFMLIFTDNVELPPKHTMSKVYITLFLSNICINVAIIFYQSVKQIYIKIKIWINKKRLNGKIKIQLESTNFGTTQNKFQKQNLSIIKEETVIDFNDDGEDEDGFDQNSNRDMNSSRNIFCHSRFNSNSLITPTSSKGADTTGVFSQFENQRAKINPNQRYQQDEMIPPQQQTPLSRFSSNAQNQQKIPQYAKSTNYLSPFERVKLRKISSNDVMKYKTGFPNVDRSYNNPQSKITTQFGQMILSVENIDNNQTNIENQQQKTQFRQSELNVISDFEENQSMEDYSDYNQSQNNQNESQNKSNNSYQSNE
eukprot:403365639